jgi:hypothetical protein
MEIRFVQHLPPQGTLTNRLNARAQFIEFIAPHLAGALGKLRAEIVFASEDMRIDKADRAKEFHLVILEQRGREKNLGTYPDGVADHPGDLVALFVDIV